MKKRLVRHNLIPVIKVPDLPISTGTLNIIEQLPHEVVMLTVMMDMDAEDVLSLCSVSTKINEICTSEYFWKLKTERDFGEVFLSEGDTWKNTYFNKLKPRRLLKQRIIAGDFDAVKDIAKDIDVPFLGDEVLLALQNDQRDIASHLIDISHSILIEDNNNVIACYMAKNPEGNEDLFLQFFDKYIYGDEAWSSQLNDKHLNLFSDILKCAILGENEDIIDSVYMSILNLFGLNSPHSDPNEYIRYAEHHEVNKKISTQLRNIYEIYKRTRTRQSEVSMYGPNYYTP